MKKKNVTKVMCIVMMMALLLSGLHIPVAEAASTTSTEKRPTIGNCENLAPESLTGELTFGVQYSSTNDTRQRITTELSDVSGDNWWISQKVNFDVRKGNEVWETVVAVTGTIGDANTGKTLRIGHIPGTNYWEVRVKKEPIYEPNSIKGKYVGSNTTVELNKDHILTAQVKNGNTLSFWIDGEKVLSDMSIDEWYEDVDWRPAFGWRSYGGLTGTCSDIKVWDGVTIKCPTIGKCENLVPDNLKGELAFTADNWWSSLTEFDKVSGDTWYFSATINFPTATTKEYHDMAVAMTSDKGTTIRIGILPGEDWYRVIYKLGNMAGYGNGAETGIVGESRSGIKIESGKDYTFTVMVKDGDKLSFWINGKRLVNGVSLKEALTGAGYSNPKLIPAFGYRGYNAYGSYSNIQVWDGVTLKPDVYTELYADISSYRGASGYTAPAPKKGYEDHVFAGWFTDASCTNPVTTETENVYAKFVTEDVLSVKAQLKYGTTANSTSTDYRFVTTVDGLSYQKIGFDITTTKTTSVPGTTVYKTILARDGEGTISYNDPTVFSEASEYFHTYSITGIPQRDFNVEFKVSAFWITLDGTKVKGPERTLSVNIGLAATTEG